MGAKRNNYHDPSTELITIREKLKASLQKEKEHEKIINDLRQKEAEAKSILEERNDLFTKLKLKEQEIDFMRKALEQSNIKLTERKKNGQILSFFGDILILISTVFTGWGINLLTSTPSNPIGWLMLAASIALFILNSLMAKILAFGGTNS
ncbi:hypothetical protein [Ktedonospora formicarum]|uniref:Uncharacterized protein n=1 Tax=Ktedonospora formicarum TaxID=2778364 RepID=A0A8J3IA96_9CHLR|nr:hypothetical protein [Ktedonospora formicarum]GHO49650.1 hypothetical protein KSX_78130 [Ktedonospora formicarum]